MRLQQKSHWSVVCSAFPSLIPSSTCILSIDRWDIWLIWQWVVLLWLITSFLWASCTIFSNSADVFPWTLLVIAPMISFFTSSGNKVRRPYLPCRMTLSLYALVHLFNAFLPIPYRFERSLAVSPCKTISFTSQSFSTIFAALSLKFLVILRHGRRHLSFIFGNLKFWFRMWFSCKRCNRTYRHSNSCMLKRCFFKKKWNQFCRGINFAMYWDRGFNHFQ